VARGGSGDKAYPLATRPYVTSSPDAPFPHLLGGHRKLVGCSVIPAGSCPGPVLYYWGSIKSVGMHVLRHLLTFDTICIFIFTPNQTFLVYTSKSFRYIMSAQSSRPKFICLFVCWYKTRKSLLRLPSWARSKPPVAANSAAKIMQHPIEKGFFFEIFGQSPRICS